MGALKCEKCGAEMKFSEAVCPACGQQVTPPSGMAVLGLLSVVALLVAVGYSVVTKERAGAAKAPPALSAEECRKDIKCLAERHLSTASVSCSKRIEESAKWQFEWTNRMLEPRFDRYLPGKAAGSVIYLGDKVKFQNGFGAWGLMRYACEFDTDAGVVISAAVESRRTY